MQLATNVTPNEFRQAVQLNRTWRYWANLFLANWYMCVLLVVILAAIGSRLIQGKPVTPGSFVILLIPAAFLGFSYVSRQRAIERGAQQLSDLDGTASLDADGIRSATSSGATSFVPWRDYTDWKEGSEVFTLAKGKSFTVLPKRGLSEDELKEARSIFQTNIS